MKCTSNCGGLMVASQHVSALGGPLSVIVQFERGVRSWAKIVPRAWKPPSHAAIHSRRPASRYLGRGNLFDESVRESIHLHSCSNVSKREATLE